MCKISNGRNVALIFACALALVPIYMAISLCLFVISGVLLNKGFIYSNLLIHTYQKYAYRDSRHIWQGDDQCVEYDPILFYKPKIGSCAFNNIEFKTTLTFDQNGRKSNHPPNSKGVAVIGDSYAMGWGVNDDETFSSLIEKKLNIPVYNLAVSSYGTYRELLRLEKSGVLDKVDTVIIQYCDNDIGENTLAVSEGLGEATPEKFKNMLHPIGYGSFILIRHWLYIAAVAPIKTVVTLLDVSITQEDFSDHYIAINKVLDKFPWIKDRKVIVFYTNGSGGKFSNFSEITKESFNTAATFIDLNLDPAAYYALDDHLTKSGHRTVAEKLSRLLE